MAGTEIAMIALLLLLAYIYLGYPLLLCALARLWPRPHSFDAAYTPSVTLLISAHNEAEVIRSKIENSLELDYPAGKFSIVVVSDCSDDGTDQKVLGFADRGVLLVRARERRGKTAALNLAMAGVTSDIVVFSDANAIYEPTAIRQLVRHFSDHSIGYVVGHARYHEETKSSAGGSEGAYWDLEVLLKRWESQFSSVVGGDGAIYAIRATLYQPMQETDINDFVNPLHIVAQGFRGIFEEKAWCTERPAGEFGREYQRKVRIVNRSFSGFLRVPQAHNPLRTGRFAWQLVSHKLLRWFSPYILSLLVAVMLLDWAIAPVTLWDQILAALVCSLLSLAAIGWLLDKKKLPHLIFYLPYYFMLVNVASAIGILLRLRGTVITTWATVRQEQDAPSGLLPVTGRLIALACLSLLALVGLVGSGLAGNLQALTVAAYLLILLLLHALLIYPSLMLPLAQLLGKPLARDHGYSPEVTLLIVAYNEAASIESKLLNSLALDYPRDLLRILVVSDGSADGTNEIVSRYADRGIELLAFPVNRGKIAAINEAMQGIDSEVVVLSDANVNYSSSAVNKLVRNLSDPRVGAVSGKVVLANSTVSYGNAERSYYSVEHAIQECEGSLGALIGADGAMYAIRRSLFTPPLADTILDDLVIAMEIARQGHLVVHEKEALGIEVNQQELKGEFYRKARIAAGGCQCLLRASGLPRLSQPLLLFCFVSHKVLRWVSGLLFLALIGVLIQIQLQSGSGAPVVLTFLLLVLAAGVLLALLVQLFPGLKRVKAANYCHYFHMLMAASLVGCYLGLTGRQKVTWRRGEV